MKKIQISNPKEIGKILDFIHDKFFNKELIRFNQQLSTLEIKFERDKWEEKKLVKKILFIKKWNIPIVESILRINFVDNYHIEDKANIGLYDFNEIKYDEKEGNIIITSGFPFLIKIKVKKFQIEIEDTES